MKASSRSLSLQAASHGRGAGRMGEHKGPRPTMLSFHVHSLNRNDLSSSRPLPPPPPPAVRPPINPSLALRGGRLRMAC
eukprot:758775-Hanusia_phi.AAC.2